MKAYLLSLFLSFCFIVKAQQNHFNFLIGFGPSYFFNDNTLNRYIDHCQMLGLNYVVSNKQQRIIFNPGINYRANEYHSPFTGSQLVHVNQVVFDLTLDMLLKITKTSYLRVGIFIDKLDYSYLFVTTTELTGRTYYFQNVDELRNTYQAAERQAGFTVGLSIPFKLFKREHKFDFKLTQTVSPIVNQDYHPSRALTGTDLKPLSVKGKPTMLIFAVDLNIHRVKKKKKKETGEEEE